MEAQICHFFSETKHSGNRMQISIQFNETKNLENIQDFKGTIK